MDFILNHSSSRGAQILLVGDNFGCGSSREHAPWALMAFGFRAVISTCFADIFRNNALKNGLLPVLVTGPVHDQIVRSVQRDPAILFTVDLEKQTLSYPGGADVTFPIDGFSRKCLLNGVDELGYLLGFQDRIAEFERTA
jgi:3-isopropylmalate/(R)-2-methylmalate dehydratase small subunit